MPTDTRDNFYSEPVQEIMGAMPSWLTRWGVTVIAGILAAIIAGCCIIKYPQTVIASVTLTSERPPSDLKARYAGLLDTVCVRDGQAVHAGDLIALFSTPADYMDIAEVERMLSSMDMPDGVSGISFEAELQLGDLQGAWQEFVRMCGEYESYLAIDRIGEQKALVRERIAKNEEYYDELLVQQTIMNKDMEYETRSLGRDSLLLAHGVISDAEYELSVKSWIAKKSAMAGFNATLTSTRLNIMQSEQQLAELDLQRADEVSGYVRTIGQLRRQFLAQTAAWKEQYAVIAPSDGTVSMQSYWSRGQHVQVGETIASVVPDDGSGIVGRLKVPSAGFGKVDIGQEVNVKLNGFPYMEFGVLKGRVASISSVPEKGQDGISYTASVHFPDGLTSSYGKEFPMVQQMDGTAEIVTRDRRLIWIFIEPVVSLFANR